MENGVVTVLYFFYKRRGYPSSHFVTFGTPSNYSCDTRELSFFFMDFETAQYSIA